MYNRVVLVCIVVNVYIPASLDRLPILRYLENCTHFTYSLRTDSYLNCREYCKQFEINTTRHLQSTVIMSKCFNAEVRGSNPGSGSNFSLET